MAELGLAQDDGPGVGSQDVTTGVQLADGAALVEGKAQLVSQGLEEHAQAVDSPHVLGEVVPVDHQGLEVLQVDPPEVILVLHKRAKDLVEGLGLVQVGQTVLELEHQGQHRQPIFELGGHHIAQTLRWP